MSLKESQLIGVIPDIHFRDVLPYSEYLKNGREQEEKEILDFIVNSFQSCDKIVFMGDIFNTVNPSSNTVKKATSFIEALNGKELYFITGNHDKGSGNKNALSFLKEIKDKQWTIIDQLTKIGEYLFCPYYFKSDLETSDNKKATKKLLKMISEEKGDILFIHHALENTSLSTEFFNEIVLPRKTLEQNFPLVVGGHIHKPFQSEKTIVAGSVFTVEVGETEKFIWTIDEKKLEVNKIKLPCRPIYKIENPQSETLKNLTDNSIIKIIVTQKEYLDNIPSIKKELDRFDSSILLEQIPDKRKKIHLDENKNLLNFSILELLEVYAKERKLNFEQLKHGFSLIQ